MGISKSHGSSHMEAEPGAWMAARRERLEALLRGHDYRGWDPFDLPNAPLFESIPDRWALPQLVLSKTGARVVPGWLREVLRVPPIEDAKIYAGAYFGYRCSEFEPARERAREMTERLAALATRGPRGERHWGYDFTWATRTSGVNPRGASTIVPGAFAIFALLHDVAASGDDRHHGLIGAALDYYRTCHRCSGSAGQFFGYFRSTDVNTHNANMLGSAALTLGGRTFEREDWLEDAARAATTTIGAVRADGYLPYADHPSGDWTDCFHHLYVIACAVALVRVNPYVDRDTFEDAIARLRRYVGRAFLRGDGLINYYPGRLYPIDPHNYAAAAIFAILCGEEADLPPASAEPLLRRVDELMWDSTRGRYHYRRHRWRVDSRLFLRWTQAWMFAALSIVDRTVTGPRESGESARNQFWSWSGA